MIALLIHKAILGGYGIQYNISMHKYNEKMRIIRNFIKSDINHFSVCVFQILCC